MKASLNVFLFVFMTLLLPTKFCLSKEAHDIAIKQIEAGQYAKKISEMTDFIICFDTLFSVDKERLNFRETKGDGKVRLSCRFKTTKSRFCELEVIDGGKWAKMPDYTGEYRVTESYHELQFVNHNKKFDDDRNRPAFYLKSADLGNSDLMAYFAYMKIPLGLGEVERYLKGYLCSKK